MVSLKDVEFQILRDRDPDSDFERAGAAILRSGDHERDRSIMGTLGAAILRTVLYLTLGACGYASTHGQPPSWASAAGAESPCPALPLLRTPPPGAAVPGPAGTHPVRSVLAALVARL